VDDDGGYLAELASRLASHTDPDSSDLALDLLLHQVVEQACQETGASGAAIALAHDGEIVCRATLGESAPDLGVRLSTRSGLSGACYQTRQMQCCDDTETDPRVDAAACRQLAIRSLVVLPVLDAGSGERLGVFELYASRPQAFHDPEIQALQILSRRIAENVRHASAAASPSNALSPRDPAATAMKVEQIKVAVPASVEDPRSGHDSLSSLTPRIREVPPEVPAIQHLFSQSLSARRRRDYWTGFLTLIVLALSLLLGWMVGRRAGWHVPQPAAVAPAPRVATQAEKEATAPATPPSPNPPAPRLARKSTATGITQAVTRSVARSKTRTEENSTGELVVYENGKVIFRMAPARKAAGSSAEPSPTAANTGLAISSNDTATGETPATLSPEAANAYLIQRVDPQYPQPAKQQRIQGPVVLDTLVGRDGVVREVKVISGDPQLALAAAAAVRQWRFRPYTPQGQPVDFATRVTLNFTLP
jgi:TonB family protein